MKLLIWFSICCLQMSLAFSQFEGKIRVKAGEDFSRLISDSGGYRFASFTTGTYSLKIGRNSSAKLNFNLFTGEMQYINYKADTLAIGNPVDISSMLIQNVMFCYDNGFKEVISNYDSIKLLVEYNIKVDYDNIGAYDQPANNAVNVVPIEAHPFNKGLSQFTAREDAVISKRLIYYILYKEEAAVHASKKNFLKIFDRKKDSINKYIKEHSIDFNKAEDLKKLLDFCVGS